jgi:deoxyribodipyrimidine photo-lyase
MCQGLIETARRLARRGVGMTVLHDHPARAACKLADRAAMVVTDRGYLRHQRRWRADVARAVDCRTTQVETDVVVPAETASRKAEYAARTIRPKIHDHLQAFCQSLQQRDLKRDSLDGPAEGLDVSSAEAMLSELSVDESICPVDSFTGGTSQAERLLDAFISDKLANYADRRGDPSLGIQSDLSPYLHFGQISPIAVALAVEQAKAPKESVAAFLEELIVRRELSVNHVLFRKNYDSFRSLPQWARLTLRDASKDSRPYVYTRRQLENAETHDPFWNAAQREMLTTGKMHNYMRMYWGKKIIEWTNRPKTAWRWMLEMNNAWELDGRDPNSYAGVGWCFGLHDRPWQRRQIFGTVRYMSAGGLKRKFDIDAYVRQFT